MQNQEGIILKMDRNKANKVIAKRKGKGSMKAKKVMSEFAVYLKSHNIYFETDSAEEEIPRITMVFKNCDMCPGRIMEGCIYFYDDCMEVRVYYSELGAQICRESEKRSEVYRLMNFLQAGLWPRVMDGMDGVLYSPQYLFCPRFYITEDNMYDITATILIPYVHYEIDALQTEDFITAALPDLMNNLSTPIFCLLMSKITVEEAITIIKTGVFGEKDD